MGVLHASGTPSAACNWLARDLVIMLTRLCMCRPAVRRCEASTQRRCSSQTAARPTTVLLHSLGAAPGCGQRMCWTRSLPPSEHLVTTPVCIPKQAARAADYRRPGAERPSFRTPLCQARRASACLLHTVEPIYMDAILTVTPGEVLFEPRSIIMISPGTAGLCSLAGSLGTVAIPHDKPNNHLAHTPGHSTIPCKIDCMSQATFNPFNPSLTHANKITGSRTAWPAWARRPRHDPSCSGHHPQQTRPRGPSW